MLTAMIWWRTLVGAAVADMMQGDGRLIQNQLGLLPVCLRPAFGLLSPHPNTIDSRATADLELVDWCIGIPEASGRGER